MWFGYNDIRREGHWVWANPSGRCKRYTNWHRGEPNNWHNEDCAQMYRSGKWNDLRCNARLPYVCEFGSRAKKICKGTTSTLNLYGIRYQIIPRKLTWGAAQANCRRHGGNLATITNSKVNHFLNYQMKKRLNYFLFWWGGEGTNYPHAESKSVLFFGKMNFECRFMSNLDNTILHVYIKPANVGK